VGAEQADVLWTDPPYGVGYVGKTPEALRIANDDPAGLEAMLADAFAAADQILCPGAALYVCHPAGPLSLRFQSAFVGAGWQYRQQLIWLKDRMVLGRSDYHYRHEPILYGFKPGRARGRGRGGWYGGNDPDSVFEVDRPAASRQHPTAKPVELISRCLANSARVGSRVLDPFAGSGSTLIACEERSLRAFVLELDPGYCGVIIERWERFTGRRAVRDDG
jgi:DNA modification methylase